MSLDDRAVLVLDSYGDASGEGVFHLQTELDETTELDRSYLLAERGQYATELVDALPGEIADPLVGGDIRRREGYHIDGGAGTHSFTLTAEVGVEESHQWGDGSAAAGEVTEYDATHGTATQKKDVLDTWLNEIRSDSGGQCHLHLTEHTDGSFSDGPGLFGEPITVAILSHRLSRDKNAEVEVTLEMQRTATLPDVRGILDGIYDDLSDALDGAVDTIGDFVPDW